MRVTVPRAVRGGLGSPPDKAGRPVAGSAVAPAAGEGDARLRTKQARSQKLLELLADCPVHGLQS